MKLKRIVRAVTSNAWAVLPEKMLAICEVLAFHMAGGKLSAEEIRARVGSPTAKRPSGGAIAILPLQGIIAHRMTMVNDTSGPSGTSTEQFGAWFDQAIADPAVSAIVIDVDSPGGTVDGVPELAAKMLGARGKKPITAVANTLAASAAYWLATAADELVVSPSAQVGSIGVFTVHEDISGAAEQAGVKFTVIGAGKYKTEGNEFEPLSEQARAAIQDRVNGYYDQFVSAIARQRGVTADAVRTGYGEGRVVNAERAVALGMADRVATLEQVTAELAGGQKTTRRPMAAATASLPVAAATAPLQIVAAAGGGAARAPIEDGAPGPQILEPAPEAKEQTMSGPTPAPAGAAPAVDTRAADLAALATEHGMQDRLPGWITGDKSVAAAKDEIMASYKAGQPAVRTLPHIVGGTPREADKPFASFGDQLRAVIQAGMPGGRRDLRLMRVNERALQIEAAASGMSEGGGAEGGFFIQPDLLPGVIDPVYADDPILSRVTRIPIGAPSNGVRYNVVDETARTTGSRWGGIQMYWGDEADTATASKPKLRKIEQNLKKLIGIAYLTDELTQDAPAAEALLSRAFQAELRFMLADAIIRGSGAGQPLGIMTSGALGTQAIEATQTIANTASFIALNVTKMLSRIPASLWGETIWLYNQELLPYLITAVVGAGGSAVPVFLSMGGLANRPNDTILGRTALASELCEAVGTPGDILAIAPSQYHMADKGGPQVATSLHVRFLFDEMTLRITYRVDGQPIWRQTVTKYKGAQPWSPFAALAVRV